MPFNGCRITASLLVTGIVTAAGGVGCYDVKAGKMLSLTLVFDGLFRNYAPNDDPPGRFGAVVEWSQCLSGKKEE